MGKASSLLTDAAQLQVGDELEIGSMSSRDGLFGVWESVLAEDEGLPLIVMDPSLANTGLLLRFGTGQSG
jgi:hypothetical protein